MTYVPKENTPPGWDYWNEMCEWIQNGSKIPAYAHLDNIYHLLQFSVYCACPKFGRSEYEDFDVK